MTTDHEPRVARPTDGGGLTTLPSEPYYRRGEQARRWGALLLIVGVVWLVFALTARGPFLPVGFVERSEPIPPQAFAAERVVIVGLGDGVEIVPADGDEVVVAGERHGFGWNGASAADAAQRLEVLVDDQGDTLRVEVRRPSLVTLGRSPYAELRIALPAGVAAEASVVSGDIAAADVRGDLRLTTVSGGVEVSDSAGALTVRTTSGDVAVSGHAGALDVETTSGDVRADGELAAPRVETVSGDVELEGASGAVEARSISGELSVRDAQGARLSIESTSGDVTFAGSLAGGESSRIGNISGDVRVRLDDPGDLRLDLSTLSGDLESDLPLRDADRERRSLTGTLGVGDTVLTISTTSGDVEVSGE